MEALNPSNTIKKWVTLYSDKMYSLAFYRTNNKEVAEDLVQDTFITAFQSFEKFKGNIEQPSAWLFTILKNKIADYYRKIYRSPFEKAMNLQKDDNDTLSQYFNKDDEWLGDSLPKDWAIESGHLLDNYDFIDVLNSCMEKLPEKWNAALQLKFIGEKKGNLICQELQITPTNFWQILHRAKLQLRSCLEHNWFKK